MAVVDVNFSANPKSYLSRHIDLETARDVWSVTPRSLPVPARAGNAPLRRVKARAGWSRRTLWRGSQGSRLRHSSTFFAQSTHDRLHTAHQFENPTKSQTALLTCSATLGNDVGRRAREMGSSVGFPLTSSDCPNKLEVTLRSNSWRYRHPPVACVLTLHKPLSGKFKGTLTRRVFGKPHGQGYNLCRSTRGGCYHSENRMDGMWLLDFGGKSEFPAENLEERSSGNCNLPSTSGRILTHVGPLQDAPKSRLLARSKLGAASTSPVGVCSCLHWVSWFLSKLRPGGDCSPGSINWKACLDEPSPSRLRMLPDANNTPASIPLFDFLPFQRCALGWGVMIPRGL